MAILIIAGWDANFHPNRVNTKATQAEADAILTTLTNNGVTGAFSVTDPGVDYKYITVDPLTNTITVDTAQQTADDLAAAKLPRNAEVNTLRATKLAAGITFNAKTFDASAMSVGGVAAKYEQLRRENASTARTITGVSLANPSVISSTAHGFSNLDRIDHQGVGGTVELSGVYTIGNVTANTYELTGIDGTAWTAFTTGGTAALVCEWTSIDNTINELSAADFLTLVNALNNYSDLCFRTAREHKNAIAALTSTASVSAYDVSVNWPSTTY